MNVLELIGGIAVIILAGLAIAHAFGVVKITATYDKDAK